MCSAVSSRSIAWPTRVSVDTSGRSTSDPSRPGSLDAELRQDRLDDGHEVQRDGAVRRAWTTWLSSFRIRIAASWARRTACSNRLPNRSLSTKVTTRSWMKPSIAFGQGHGEDAGPVGERVGEEGPQIEGAGHLPRQRVADRRVEGRVLGERRHPVREPRGRQEVPASPDADDRRDQAHAGEEHQQTGDHSSEAAVLRAGLRLLVVRAASFRRSGPGGVTPWG